MRDLGQVLRVEQVMEVLRRLLTKPQSLTADTTLKASNTVASVDASGGAVTITLPLASQHVSRVYSIKKVDASANAVTITPSSTDTVDGAASYSLTNQWDSVTVISTGTEWLVFGHIATVTGSSSSGINALQAAGF